jgi:biopolymer transport protein ExbD
MRSQERRRFFLAKRKSDINITPLIDVLLVLIVIFMVITPVNQKGFDTRVPQPASSKEEPERPDTLILRLDRYGNVRLNQETLESASLFARLQEVFSTRSDRTLFVQADNEVLYNEVAQLIDTARGAGADRIGLMTRNLSLGH